MSVFEVVFFTKFFAVRAFVPIVGGGFVAAEVDVGGRENVFQLVKNGIVKFPDFGVGGANEFFGNAGDFANFEFRVWEANHLGVGTGEGLVMAGHIDFGDDFDVMLCGVAHDVLELGFGVDAAVGDLVAVGARAFRGDGFEFGVAGDGEAPALVVGEVDVEFVEFVRRHRVDERFDVLGFPEMAGGVDHHAAPAEAWVILDGQARELGSVLGLELFEGLFGVEKSRVVAVFDGDTLGGEDEGVGFFAEAGREFFGKNLSGGGLVGGVEMERLGLGDDGGFFGWCGDERAEWEKVECE